MALPLFGTASTLAPDGSGGTVPSRGVTGTRVGVGVGVRRGRGVGVGEDVGVTGSGVNPSARRPIRPVEVLSDNAPFWKYCTAVLPEARASVRGNPSVEDPPSEPKTDRNLPRT